MKVLFRRIVFFYILVLTILFFVIIFFQWPIILHNNVVVPRDSYMEIKVGMDEARVLESIYQGDSLIECGDNSYKKHKLRPSLAIAKEEENLYWIWLDRKGRAVSKTLINPADANDNSFFEQLGYQYPLKRITCKVLVFRGDPHIYVYLDRTGKVTDIFAGES